MLVDRIRNDDVTGSVLVVRGKKPDGADQEKHDKIIRELHDMYLTHVEVHYFGDMLANPGPQMRMEIRRQLKRLDACVNSIKAQLTVGMVDPGHQV